MDDPAAGGALTEIALALAMAFFCILVLTLVSVGNPADGGSLSTAPRLETGGPGAASRPVAGDETLVVFHGGRFFDRDGAAVDPAAIPHGPVVLAVDPALPIDSVLAARAAIGRPAVTVTTLDADWLGRLAVGWSDSGGAR